MTTFDFIKVNDFRKISEFMQQEARSSIQQHLEPSLQTEYS